MICHETGLLVKPSYGRFVYYKLLTLVPLGTALLAIFRYADSIVWPLVYIGVCLGHVFLVYTNKCPHCGYYHLEGRQHRCSWLWHIPKLVKPKPGPQGRFISIYIPVGILIFILFPIYWLRFEWELLVIFLLSVAGLLATVLTHECRSCISFHCSNNQVPEKIREKFKEIHSSR
ncbi:MAG: hypothetical protein JSV52_12865 [Candidatus Zixiibacteriota bacterium]|nr:MAG: hypothetical protein JSV52_12865 [candidate division Zixibacteria bacterium]